MYHENQDVYTSNDSPFEVRGDSLYMYVSSRHGSGVQKICNFVPCIVQEKTVDSRLLTVDSISSTANKRYFLMFNRL